MSGQHPFRLGLTGSIGMGKSTTAAMFARRGLPVWDADAAVARLYAPGGAGVAPVAALVPEARTAAGGIDRAALRAAVRARPALLRELERIVHPLVVDDRRAFLERAGREGAPVVVLDIPLLFETGAEREMDAVAVVSAPEEVQRARVLARPGMDPTTLEMILARQMPDSEKRVRARWVIPTTSIPAAEAMVDRILKEIEEGR